jgi:hypothetical protein
MQQNADKGVGIAGTYMPHEGTVGFMECGLAASDRMCHHMFGITQSRATEERAPNMSFVDREIARRATPPSQQLLA